jgi:hypothetical protein
MKKINSPLIIDNILSQSELLTIYSELVSTAGWYLNRWSLPDQDTVRHAGFCGLRISDDKNYYHPYLMGKINFILEKIKLECLKKNKILPNKIFRVDCVAKQKDTITKPHMDLDREDAISIVGLLTPVWQEKCGGDFFILNNEKIITDQIKHKPGQFIILNSNQYHDGKGPEIETEYWRIVLNIVLTN